MAYEALSIDVDLASQVQAFLDRHPGLWPSKRALYHELLRRGLMSFGPAPSPPPAPVAMAGSHVAAPEGLPPSGGRTTGGRPPRRPKKEEVSGGAGAAAPEAGVPPRTEQPVIDVAVVPASAAAPTTSDANAPEPTGAGISTWTCPRCRVEIPLAEREAHRASHEGSRAREEQRKTAPDLARLEARVLEQTRAGLPRMLEKGTEQLYLVALVRHALEEQGVDELDLPAADVAVKFLRKLAGKSSVIRRALEVVA